MRLPKSWQRTARNVLDLVFPPQCVVCQQSGGWLCADCQDKIELIQPPVCPQCGQPVSVQGPCLSCRKDPVQIDGIRAVGYLEGPLRTAIHHFKYSHVRPLAPILGRLLSDYLLRHELPADVVIPVPLHPRRLKERGYNQAALLAKEIQNTLELRLAEDALIRVRSTRPQVGLNARQRRDNVRGAFRYADNTLEGQSILLVDDVCTTGATLEACSLALRQAGAAPVWGIVLARERWPEREN